MHVTQNMHVYGPAYYAYFLSRCFLRCFRGMFPYKGSRDMPSSHNWILVARFNPSWAPEEIWSSDYRVGASMAGMTAASTMWVVS